MKEANFITMCRTKHKMRKCSEDPTPLVIMDKVKAIDSTHGNTMVKKWSRSSSLIIRVTRQSNAAIYRCACISKVTGVMVKVTVLNI